MEVIKVYWIEHPDKLGLISAGKLRSFFAAQLKDESLSGDKIDDYDIIEKDAEEIEKLKLKGVNIEILEGM